jgi:hypothetical protein
MPQPQQSSFVNDLIWGKPQSFQQLPTGNPEQLNTVGMANKGVQNLLQGGTPYGFDALANKQREEFQTRTLPSIANQFTNNQRSSAFRGALGKAAAGLNTNLSALGAQLGQDQLRSLQPYALQSTFQNLEQPRQPGFIENASNAFANALPDIAMAGATQGASLLPALMKRLFQNKGAGAGANQFENQIQNIGGRAAQNAINPRFNNPLDPSNLFSNLLPMEGQPYTQQNPLEQTLGQQQLMQLLQQTGAGQGLGQFANTNPLSTAYNQPANNFTQASPGFEFNQGRLRHNPNINYQDLWQQVVGQYGGA